MVNPRRLERYYVERVCGETEKRREGGETEEREVSRGRESGERFFGRGRKAGGGREIASGDKENYRKEILCIYNFTNLAIL